MGVSGNNLTARVAASARTEQIAEGRRLHAYRVTGRYRDELAEARRVA